MLTWTASSTNEAKIYPWIHWASMEYMKEPLKEHNAVQLVYPLSVMIAIPVFY